MRWCPVSVPPKDKAAKRPSSKLAARAHTQDCACTPNHKRNDLYWSYAICPAIFRGKSPACQLTEVASKSRYRGFSPRHGVRPMIRRTDGQVWPALGAAESRRPARSPAHSSLCKSRGVSPLIGPAHSRLSAIGADIAVLVTAVSHSAALASTAKDTVARRCGLGAPIPDSRYVRYSAASLQAPTLLACPRLKVAALSVLL